MGDSIAGLQVWEREDWLAPSDEGLPEWLLSLRQRHLDAVREYQSAIAGVVDTSAQVEAEARAWRRSVRDAVAQGRKPPERTGGDEIDAVTVMVVQEDADHAKRQLAICACELLNEIRGRRTDFEPFFLAASPALRHSLGAGPDGLLQAERERVERQQAMAQEPSMIDLSDPAHDQFSKLDQEAAHAAA